MINCLFIILASWSRIFYDTTYADYVTVSLSVVPSVGSGSNKYIPKFVPDTITSEPPPPPASSGCPNGEIVC